MAVIFIDLARHVLASRRLAGACKFLPEKHLIALSPERFHGFMCL